MGNKNVNHGIINTEGGPVEIGDKNITNIFEGLTTLFQEYKEQLESINNLIHSFKPKTALALLVDLEKRILEKDLPEKDKIKSKLIFLKALCKIELIEYSKEEAAKDFIQSYLLNKQDNNLRDRACVEYLNLDDESTAIALANELYLPTHII